MEKVIFVIHQVEHTMNLPAGSAGAIVHFQIIQELLQQTNNLTIVQMVQKKLRWCSR